VGPQTAFLKLESQNRNKIIKTESIYLYTEFQNTLVTCTIFFYVSLQFWLFLYVSIVASLKYGENKCNTLLKRTVPYIGTGSSVVS
jgi:hypothetical protein